MTCVKGSGCQVLDAAPLHVRPPQAAVLRSYHTGWVLRCRRRPLPYQLPTRGGSRFPKLLVETFRGEDVQRPQVPGLMSGAGRDGPSAPTHPPTVGVECWEVPAELFWRHPVAPCQNGGLSLVPRG